MIINIIGKPGTGKSTLMVNLACSLAKKGRKVALMTADLSYQSIQYYFGNTKIETEQSLGLMFQKKDFLKPEKYFIKVQGYGNIYVAGISTGESSLRYDAPEKEDIIMFLEESKNNFDCIFIENPENIRNGLTFLSLMKSAAIFDVVDISIQGISYKLSTEDILKSININKRIYRILSASKNIENIKNAEKILKFKFDYQIPYCNISDDCANSGIPIIYTAAGEGRIKFINFIDRLTNEIEREVLKIGQ